MIDDHQGMDHHGSEQVYLADPGLKRLTSGEPRIPVALRLAETCAYEASHTHQVTRLALSLFDQMQTLHRLGDVEKFWLEAAAILHDIGWVDGWRGHHKSSLRIILQSTMLPFSSRERLAIGSIARYHRKALPDEQHDHFNALSFRDRQVVKMLSAILRVADGLDSTHKQRVKEIKVQCTTRKVNLVCLVDQPIVEEQKIAIKKGNLLELVYNRKLSVTWQIGD